MCKSVRRMHANFGQPEWTSLGHWAWQSPENRDVFKAASTVKPRLALSVQSRQQRLQLGDQVRDATGRHQPNPVLLDLSVVVSQYISLRHNLTPWNPGMLRLELRRHESSSLADDLYSPLNRQLELAIE